PPCSASSTPKLYLPVVGKGHALSAADRLRSSEIHLVGMFYVPLQSKGTGVGMPTPYIWMHKDLDVTT
ncbi:MAG: hypothetical protein IJW45_01320, partial [Oscillospiraceae bacterium]|nr:hypothetical protein [Oscillospiraceae bacterium]